MVIRTTYWIVNRDGKYLTGDPTTGTVSLQKVQPGNKNQQWSLTGGGGAISTTEIWQPGSGFWLKYNDDPWPPVANSTAITVEKPSDVDNSKISMGWDFISVASDDTFLENTYCIISHANPTLGIGLSTNWADPKQCVLQSHGVDDRTIALRLFPVPPDM